MALSTSGPRARRVISKIERLVSVSLYLGGETGGNGELQEEMRAAFAHCVKSARCVGWKGVRPRAPHG
eukprot:scaffold23137_cov66-Phaeocystis_antarctica.AAC.12